MRWPHLAVLILTLSATGFSQPKTIVEEKGAFSFFSVADVIRQSHYLESENKLLLIGSKNIQLLDLTSFKSVYTKSLALPFADRRREYGNNDWSVSPDGRFIALTGLAEGHSKTGSETRQVAWILDLMTGNRVARLEHPEQVSSAAWSKNGKTLMSSNANGSERYPSILNVIFWDGETLAYRQSITIENAIWIHLSDDGQRFFAAVGKGKTSNGTDTDAFVRIWKTSTGEIEKTIISESSRKASVVAISPNQDLMLLIDNDKSKASSSLSAWQLKGGANPLYALPLKPRPWASRVLFTPDGSSFALEAGKEMQIYNVANGKLKAKLTKIEQQVWGWLDNEVLFSFDYKSKGFFGIEKTKTMKAFAASDGRELFKLALPYDEREVSEVDDPNFLNGREILDNTVIKAHPTRNVFVAISSEFVKLFDSRTGELLQTVIEPPVEIDLLGKPKTARNRMVRSADWSKNGNALYIFGANGQSVSLWRFTGD
jgi:WD40 repeat protein